MEITDEERYEVATANRLLAADMFATLTEEQWRTPSLCAGWTVREIAAHLVPPTGGVLGLAGLVANVVRYRGDLGRMVDQVTRKDARRPTDQIVRELREGAQARFKPPVVGAAGPMSDTAIHLRDAARPLGLDVNPPPASWIPVLEFLVSKPATRGFLPAGRLAGLRLSATDEAWSWGEGQEVRGTCEAVALAVSGRGVVLPELEGDGVSVLAGRVRSSGG